MKAYIQFIGQSSPEGPPSIIVHYDSQRYMFNCREGTQRLCVEERVRLSKLRDIYLTRVAWDNIGGMPGMLLTLADAGVKDLTIHGPKNLTHFLVGTRHFIYRTSLALDTNEFNNDNNNNNNNNNATVENRGPLKVTPIHILPDHYSPSGTKRRHNDENAVQDQEYRKSVLRQMFPVGNKSSSVPAHTIEAPCTPRGESKKKKKTSNEKNPDEIAIDMEEDLLDNKKNNNNNNNNNNSNDGTKVYKSGHPLGIDNGKQPQRPMDYLRNPLPRTRPYPVATSYICRGPTLPGKFNPKAAKELGLAPGPNYGRLQRGQTITLDDGRTIEPNQVVGPSSPGHLFMIIDCPDQSYLNNLIHSNAFKQYQQTKEKKDQPCSVIHLIGQDVLEDKRYREWMNLFSPNTEHIISTPDICAQTVLYKAHAYGQVKLSKLDNQIFPVPHYSNIATRKLNDYKDLPKKCIPLSNMLKYNLEPKPGVVKEEHHEFDHDEACKQINRNQEFMESVQKAKKNASTVQLEESFPGDNVEIITLGTGSSIPSKYRNVSATLVKTPENGSIMLDAGEGTLGQMMRRFGHELDKELRQLQCIFVSHLHADHHLGVIQLLTKWAKLNNNDNKKLYVVAPFIFNTWLHEYSGVEPFQFGDKIVMVRNESILTNRYPMKTELEHFEGLKKAIGINKMNAVNVIHCRYAYGLTMDHQTGWKLVYSGDTRPCDNLVEAGKNATLLIHEATLEDSMKAEAIAKRHSTTEEAVEIGQSMNAKYTLLNHFSQRYPKVPSLSKEQSNVCFSFDLMTIPIKRIPVLPKFTETISLLFKEEKEEEENQQIDS
ncbi:hypothetical protein INT45_004075 [Circinella minor]|uniref:Zinc phosphodiesterase ELAC protein 2 n=1 Tax=Circinella minor TaxID=1195481 RepID=A0A8H7VBH8_9FUNG|nr:hypothetical protein INT45_004075 [Circinella minor]